MTRPVNLSETWECPACQTLNVAGANCYSCGAARPGVVAGTPPPAPAIDWQPAEIDTEPHPCWCDLVKGPHDTRDHPVVADAVDDTMTDKEADAYLDQLEIDLARLTNDWTLGPVERSYDSGDDGEQEYEDEAMLFEDHGYSKWVERPHGRIDARYTLGGDQS